MKTTLLLATVALLTAVNTSLASDQLHSPKGRAVADSLRIVPGRGTDTIDRSIPRGTPKGLEFAHSLRQVPSSSSRVDLVHGPRPVISAKDPRYESGLRELRTREFSVAPLK